MPITCVNRASAGREKEWANVPRAAVKRRAVVVGGGPAGLEAARRAGRRAPPAGASGWAIVYNTLSGRERAIEGVDTIVAAVGGVADCRLYLDLFDTLPALHAVGDCRAPRGLENAIHEGFKAALGV